MDKKNYGSGATNIDSINWIAYFVVKSQKYQVMVKKLRVKNVIFFFLFKVWAKNESIKKHDGKKN